LAAISGPLNLLKVSGTKLAVSINARWIDASEGIVMRTLIFGLLWTFTNLAAAFDAYFAWRNRAGFESWELNPVVCWLAGLAGLQAVIGFKMVTTVFATALACLCRWRRHWLEMPYTLIVTSVFLSLSVYYLLHFQELSFPDPLQDPTEEFVYHDEYVQHPAGEYFLSKGNTIPASPRQN
jgi:hypothetical protein